MPICTHSTVNNFWQPSFSYLGVCFAPEWEEVLHGVVRADRWSSQVSSETVNITSLYMHLINRQDISWSCMYCANLICRGVDKAGIGSWDWKLKEDKCTYHALFPRSWTVYDGKLVAAFQFPSSNFNQTMSVRWRHLKIAMQVSLTLRSRSPAVRYRPSSHTTTERAASQLRCSHSRYNLFFSPLI